MSWPVKVPYTTRPSMTKLEGDLYNRTPDLYYLESKYREISNSGDDLWAVAPDKHYLIELACKKLGLPVTSDIINFAMRFEEDVAIVNNGRLAAICFCFPSSWIPKTKIGLSLTDIHEPVADGDYLRSASDKLAKTMADPVLGCFRRSVWTIKTSGQLSNHPKYSLPPALSIDDLWFRTEDQTTMPLGDGSSSLFFVKVKTQPLAEIWTNKDKRQSIIDSVNSMTDAVLDYKNLREIKSLINDSVILKSHLYDHAIG